MVLGLVSGDQAVSWINQAYNIILIMILLGGVGYGIFWFYMKSKFNKYVTIRKKAGKSFVEIYDICQEKVDSDGHKWWVRKGERDKFMKLMPAPSASCITVNNKGKECATAKLVDGYYFWLEDQDNVAAYPADLFANMPDNIKNEQQTERKQILEYEWKTARIAEWKQKNGIDYAFHPMTSNQRAILVNTIRRAEERKQKGWQTQLPMIAGLAACVIIVLALILFYGSIAQPVLAMGDKLVAYESERTEQMQLMKEIKSDIQVLKVQQVGNTNTPPGGK